MKKLLVLTIAAGILGLSGLGCNKDNSGKTTQGTKVTAETKAGGDTKH